MRVLIRLTAPMRKATFLLKSPALAGDLCNDIWKKLSRIFLKFFKASFS